MPKRRPWLFLFSVFFILTSTVYAEDIPDKLVGQLRSRSYDQVKNKSPVAEVFLCDLYCDLLTTVYVDDKDSPSFKTKPPVEWSKLTGELRMTWLKAAFAQGTSGPGGKGELGSGIGGGSGKDQPSNTAISFELGLIMSKRSLDTSANTDTQSDAKLHPMGHFGVGFDLDDLANFGPRALGLISELNYDGGLSENSVNLDPTRSSSFSRFDFLVGVALRKGKNAKVKAQLPWTFKFFIETQYDIFSTSPNTPLGFSSNYLMAGPGVAVRYHQTELRLSKSVFGAVQDSDNFRGLSVSGSFLHLSLSSCLDLMEVGNTFLQICPNAYLISTSVSGSGTPLQPVLTTDPTYSYKELGIGINFRLDRLSL